MIQQQETTLQPKPRGFHLVTGELTRQVPKQELVPLNANVVSADDGQFFHLGLDLGITN